MAGAYRHGENLLAGCVQECETACYACLKTFRNQFYHSMLNRHDGLELVDKLNFLPEGYRDIVPVFEEEKSGEGTPSNPPEAVLVNLLKEHHFPEGKCREQIKTLIGHCHVSRLAARTDQGGRVR